MTSGMGTDAPLTTDMAFRSKSQVLMDEWGATDRESAAKADQARRFAPEPPIETWSTLTLPYQAPSSPPLLSWDRLRAFSVSRRIEKSLAAQRKEGEQNERLHENAGFNSVYRFGEYVVKWGCNPKIIDEAENMLFLAEHLPRLRIPTLLAAWTVETDNKEAVFCIMMNYINGVRLNCLDQFPKMDIKAQDIICAKVSAQIAYLHSLSLPSGEWYYGRVNRQAWVKPPPNIETFTTLPRNVTPPFTTYEEFIAAIERSTELQEALHTFNVPYEDFFPSQLERRRKLGDMLKNFKPQEPKLTWLDPKFKNMVAVPIGGNAETATDWDVFLVDLEDLGWYPAWMQWLQLRARCGALILAPDRQSVSPHRDPEIMQMLMKDLGPNCDWEKYSALLRSVRWRFY
ncbi:hypothetical protein PMIN01_09722 [Paraphaeosphaeria minitans]|uniref:Aminoglycoside phosphotransferase domain-containing protein n=1 Tax=Paraphaeosphaeria minitans TaxID=565426 RepID=A0A9P6GAM2_9PLEO|nr:hypothetical protein PMIN01_09722 [Paraphaeosphaeria minitans]